MQGSFAKATAPPSGCTYRRINFTLGHEFGKPDLDMLSECAERYGVSLVAAVRRWLDYTERRAVLVVSREGFILWARSSGAALRTGAFFRTATNTIPLPERSLACRQDGAIDGRQGIELPAAVWFAEPVREMTVFADQYDFAITLLLLGDQMIAALATGCRRRVGHLRSLHGERLTAS